MNVKYSNTSKEAELTTADHVRHRKERQNRLTLVGPGTPMGKYMRCFWHPVAALAELENVP